MGFYSYLVQYLLLKALPSKMLLIMKLIILIILTACLQVNARVSAQKVNLKVNNLPLEQVLATIKQQTGYVFIYRDRDMAKAKLVNANFTSKPLIEALDELFGEQPLTYKIKAKTISLYLKKEIPGNAETAVPPPANIDVTVVVATADGQPLEGASILIKGEIKAIATDINGRAVVKNIDPNATLVISYTGYSSQEIKVAGRTFIGVRLKVFTSELDQVQIIGYGLQRKKDVVGSVSKVNTQDLVKAPVRSFDEALAGRVAGVQVASADGQPGSSINIIIRGANSISQDNSPLYVIDGFPREGGDNNNNLINPQDIESIDVLKDAAATAIYGARGANGVILITTKRGKEGPPVIAFNATYSTQKAIKMMKTLGPVDYFKLQADNATPNGVGNYDTYRFYGLGLSYIRDTAEAINFQDKLFKPASMQDYTVSITGGSKMTRYALSGNYLNQDGVLINTSYKRYLGRVVLDQQLSEKLKTGINTAYTYTFGAGASPSATANGSGSGSVMNSIWGYRPFAGSGNPATNLDAKQLIDYPIDPLLTGQNNYLFNPLIDQQHLVRTNKANNLFANGYLEYSIMPELKLRISGGIDYTTSENVSFNDSLTVWGSKLSAVGINGPNGSISNSIASSWVNENTLNYVKTFHGQHNINVLLGLSEQGYKNRSVQVSNTSLLYPGLGIYGLSQSSATGLVNLSQSSGLWTAESFFGRVLYNYLSRYYFTASLRADGSSKFAEGNRWGMFPSFGASWRLSEEPFMKKLRSVISESKIRVTYGQSGNNRIPIFSYLSQVASGYNGLSHNSTFSTYNGSPAYTFNNVVAPASVLSTLGNKALKWETTSSINLGLDLGFFNDQLNLVVDAYQKNTYNLLYNAPVPTSLGFNNAYKNIGNIQNKGLEISINTINVRKRDFSWSSSFNISFNRNKVLSLTEGLESAPIFVQWDNGYNTVAPYILKVGQPLGALYGLVWDGNYQYRDFVRNAAGQYILKDNVPSNQSSRTSVAGGAPQPGDIKFKDLNGDGVITNADLTVIGRGFPLHTGGFGNNFSYKGFDLNLFFQWSYGNQVQNANRIWYESNAIGGRNQFESVKNRWTPDNQNNILFRAGTGVPQGPNLYSTRTLEDGSYLRFKTFSLGYNLPDKLLKKYKVKGARLFISGQNLYTWTKYSGSDPEVTVTYGQPYALAPGFDFSAYPRARTFSFGTNISF